MGSDETFLSGNCVRVENVQAKTLYTAAESAQRIIKSSLVIYTYRNKNLKSSEHLWTTTHQTNYQSLLHKLILHSVVHEDYNGCFDGIVWCY